MCRAADELRNRLERDYLEQLKSISVTVDGATTGHNDAEKVEPPMALSWYPGNLAYKLVVSTQIVIINLLKFKYPRQTIPRHLEMLLGKIQHTVDFTIF